MSVNDDGCDSSSNTTPGSDLSQRSVEEIYWEDATNLFSDKKNETGVDDTEADNNEAHATTIPMPMRSYCKWSPSKQGATLVWRDVCVYATDTNQPRPRCKLKRIINNSTGAIQPGTLMALMGSRYTHPRIIKKLMRITIIRIAVGLVRVL